MPDPYPYLQALQDTWLSTFIRDTKWCFPAIEMVHLFGMVTLLGTMLAFDLRLMNVWLQRRPVSLLMKRLLPWTWTAFAVMICTGTGLFISDPLRFFHNTSFQIKMGLIVLAGVNALAFQLTSLRTLGQWDLNIETPRGAKVAGFLSMVLWFGVAAAGRWIAFV
jgi:Family of unknown function (DUF6644)